MKDNINKNSLFIVNAHNIIDIQRAEDTVKIILKLFEKKAEGIVNIGTGNGIEIQKFAKKFTKKKITIKTNSKKKISIIADVTRLNSIIK